MKTEAQRYSELTIKKSVSGVSGMTMDELRELEDLHQMAKRDGLREGITSQQREAIRQEIRNDARERINEGKEPFEETYLSRWQWNKSGQRYDWNESSDGQNRPSDYKEGFSWQPEILREQSRGPEGNPQSMI